MHKCSLLLTLLCMAVLQTGCSGVHRLDRSKTEVFSVSAMMADTAKRTAFSKTIEEGGEAIVMIPEGTVMPFSVELNIPIATLKSGQSEIQFDRDVYVYISSENIMISPDGEKWAELGDMSTIRQLFDFGQRAMRFGLVVSEEKGPYVSISVETK